MPIDAGMCMNMPKSDFPVVILGLFEHMITNFNVYNKLEGT